MDSMTLQSGMYNVHDTQLAPGVNIIHGTGLRNTDSTISSMVGQYTLLEIFCLHARTGLSASDSLVMIGAESVSQGTRRGCVAHAEELKHTEMYVL